MSSSRIMTPALALAAIMTAGTADAQERPITPSSANVLDLLAPFLTLNRTAIGRQTLAVNLRAAIAQNRSATIAQQQIAISDKNQMPTIRADGTVLTRAEGDNIAGGLPPLAIQGTGFLHPFQPVGGLGPRLGPIFETELRDSDIDRGPLGATYALLKTTYLTMIPDVNVAKAYFANGTARMASPSDRTAGRFPPPAIGPDGRILPHFAGLPNPRESVYDLAYRAKGARAGIAHDGSPRPLRVAGARYDRFDPTAMGVSPSFPSGHTQYAYTHGTLIAMLVPSAFRSVQLRASEFANSRILLGVHYPLDVIASRALSYYELAQALTNPLYRNNPAMTGRIAGLPMMDAPGMFVRARSETEAYLARACHAPVATCAAAAMDDVGNPYRPDARNAAIYRFRLTYGLPTLSFRQAPREHAPGSGPGASILLASLFGGDDTAARAIAPDGGLYGRLTTATIDRILQNTQGKALAAFAGTPLGYWSRLNLWAAAGYFDELTDRFRLGAADRLRQPVKVGRGGALIVDGTLSAPITVARGGRLSGTGTVATVAVEGGGTLAPTGRVLHISGDLLLSPAAIYRVAPAADDRVGRTEITGYALLSGRLQVRLPPEAYRPCMPVPILLARGGIAGRFASVGGRFGRLKPSLRYGATRVTLMLKRPGTSCGGGY